MLLLLKIYVVTQLSFARHVSITAWVSLQVEEFFLFGGFILLLIYSKTHNIDCFVVFSCKIPLMQESHGLDDLFTNFCLKIEHPDFYELLLLLFLLIVVPFKANLDQ